MADKDKNAGDLILEGVKKATNPLAESEDKSSQALGEAERASERTERAEREETSAAKQYVEAIQNLKAARNAFSDDLREAEKTAREANAEQRVADVVAQGQVVGIGDALEFLKEQDEAEGERKDAESDLFKATIEGAGQVASSAMGVVAEGLQDTLAGIDGSFDSGGIIALVGGGVAGTALGAGSPLSDAAAGFVDNYAALKAGNPVGEGVEEKTVDGLGSEEEYLAYMAANGNGEPEDPYMAENGGQGEADPKNLPAPPAGYVATPASSGPSDPNDALATDDFTDLTDPEKIMAENAALAAQPTAQDAPEGGILAAIAESDIVKAAVQTVADTVTSSEPEVPDVDEDFDDPSYGLG